MKIKTFDTGVTDKWEKLDKQVNDFIADKTVIDIKTAMCGAVNGFTHTVTVMYKDEKHYVDTSFDALIGNKDE